MADHESSLMGKSKVEIVGKVGFEPEVKE